MPGRGGALVDAAGLAVGAGGCGRGRDALARWSPRWRACSARYRRRASARAVLLARATVSPGCRTVGSGDGHDVDGRSDGWPRCVVDKCRVSAGWYNGVSPPPARSPPGGHAWIAPGARGRSALARHRRRRPARGAARRPVVHRDGPRRGGRLAGLDAGRVGGADRRRIGVGRIRRGRQPGRGARWTCSGSRWSTRRRPGSTVTRKATWTSSLVLDPGRRALLVNGSGAYAGVGDLVVHRRLRRDRWRDRAAGRRRGGRGRGRVGRRLERVRRGPRGSRAGRGLQP